MLRFVQFFEIVKKMDIQSDTEESNENIYVLAEQKIQFGESLKMYIDQYPNVDGLQKLSRKINQELKFLRKVSLY